MSPSPRPHDVRFLSSPDELRDWFDANHATATELWLGHHRKSTGRPTIAWSDAVDEALCVGWIDGVRYSLDDERFAQRFTPRRKGSNWSAINVQKVAELTKQGRMRPAGLAAFEARTPERTGVYSYEREAATFDCGRGRALPGGRGGLGRLAATRTVVSPGRDLLGGERQATGDPRAGGSTSSSRRPRRGGSSVRCEPRSTPERRPRQVAQRRSAHRSPSVRAHRARGPSSRPATRRATTRDTSRSRTTR